MSRNNFTFVRTTLLALAITSLSIAMGGCSSMGSGGSDRDGDRTDATRGGASSIPEDAHLVDEGIGRLMYTARRDGRVYIYDVNERQLVFSGRMYRGQDFVLIPNENRATVDDRDVFNQDLKRQHEHRIYYLSEDEGRRSDREGDLPPGASRVAEGRGVVTFRAHDSGRAYVYDSEDKHVIVSHHLRDGQSIRVDADHDRITVDGNVIYDSNLERNHEHRIYFDKD